MLKNILLVSAFAVIVMETTILTQAGQAGALRRAVEQTEFACIDGDHLSQGEAFSECTRIVWRYADEDGVR